MAEGELLKLQDTSFGNVALHQKFRWNEAWYLKTGPETMRPCLEGEVRYRGPDWDLVSGVMVEIEV